MLDEIQSGMARSGKLFAHQHETLLPDVMTLAKALGNGVPIGACVAAGPAADVFKPGNHGSTFGGNPLACHAAHATLQTMIDENVAANAATRGEQLATLLRAELADNPGVAEVRHLGLLFAIEMTKACQPIVEFALQQGLLINVTAGKVVRVLPPLIIDESQTEELGRRLVAAIRQFTD